MDAACRGLREFLAGTAGRVDGDEIFGAWFNLVLVGKWTVSAWFLEDCTAGCGLRGFRAGTAGEADGDDIFGAWSSLDLVGKWAFSTVFW